MDPDGRVSAALSSFLVPAASVPVPSQVCSVNRDDDDMTDAGIDRRFTPRTYVCLLRLIRLDGVDDLIIRPFGGGCCGFLVVGFGRHERWRVPAGGPDHVLANPPVRCRP